MGAPILTLVRRPKPDLTDYAKDGGAEGVRTPDINKGDYVFKENVLKYRAHPAESTTATRA
jgi:hypothetical protein